jgi:hypothetical protein
LKGDITRITVSGRVSGEHDFGGAGAGHTASVLRIVSPGATLATVADVKKGSEDKQERVEEGTEKGYESQVSVSGKFTSMRSKCNLKLVDLNLSQYMRHSDAFVFGSWSSANASISQGSFTTLCIHSFALESISNNSPIRQRTLIPRRSPQLSRA